MSVIDGVASKYILTYLGWVVLSIPFLDTTPSSSMHNMTSEAVLWEYHTVSKMMLNFSTAIGALLLSGRDVVRCLGMTKRICDFEELLDALVASSRGPEERIPGMSLRTDPTVAMELKNVPLVTPQGEVLVPALSLTVKQGVCILITGPNGSGKSSLMRVLAGIWTPTGGSLFRSSLAEMIREESFSRSSRGFQFKQLNPGMVYLPQKPYMPIGNLRDQVLYPASYPDWEQEASSAKRSDFDDALTNILHRVHLEYLLEREGGWDAVADWSAILSGGERQRISIARLYYHRPTFALLDESTSAVHEEIEDSIYQGCRELGITMLTVSHRRSLRKHHATELKLDGRGGFSLIDVDN